MSEATEEYKTDNKTITVYEKAIIKFGVDNQLKKLSQELLELGLALSHMEEGRHDHNVHEELADVRIMLRQIIPLFNDTGQVDYWHNLKTERLDKRIG